MTNKRDNYHPMILSETAGQLPEELTFQNKLRKAAFDGVTEKDVKEVVAGIVKRAKEGDSKAVDHLFEYIMGANRPVKVTQNNYYDEAERDAAMTRDASEPEPGSGEQIQNLRQRASGRKSLFPNGHKP